MVERALAESPALRADLRRLLGKTAARRLPRLAAASSGPLSARDGEGCRIRFEASRAEPSQVYVIIELQDEEAPAPRSLIVCDDSGSRKFALPPPHNGTVQVLVERDSDLIGALSDLGSEVYLG